MRIIQVHGRNAVLRIFNNSNMTITCILLYWRGKTIHNQRSYPLHVTEYNVPEREKGRHFNTCSYILYSLLMDFILNVDRTFTVLLCFWSCGNHLRLHGHKMLWLMQVLYCIKEVYQWRCVCITVMISCHCYFPYEYELPRGMKC